MVEQKTILIVDDLEANVDALLGLLEDRYDVVAALEGESALEIMEGEPVDLVLLDIVMPGMDGFEVCRRIKARPETARIPVIFITANTDEASIERAYEAGGVDYITKPFRAMEVLSRIANHLALSAQQNHLEQLVEERTRQLQDLNVEIEETMREIIFTMGTMAEMRSQETGNHVKRVARYSQLLARHYGLGSDEVELIKEASPMHDVGKIAIPDAILNKPGRLTPQEYEVMKEHARLGYEMLRHSKRRLIKAAAIIAHQHHERWDGTGYPQGLKGEAIHIFGRITALVDVFDALGTERVYKRAWKDDEIFAFIKEQRGRHFEPRLVDLFFEHLDQLLEIRSRLSDPSLKVKDE